MDIYAVLFGLVFGAIAAWMIAKYKFTLEKGISDEELQRKYVHKEVFESLQVQSDLYRDDLLDKESEIRSLGQNLASTQQLNLNLQEKLTEQKAEVEELQTRFQTEFENVANRLLDEKSQKFSLQNQEQLQHILAPLREKIKDFEQGMEQKFLQETKDRVSLKKEIEHLSALNQQLSQDANNLVTALRGDSKTQGDWGEFQLEMLLEKSGLTKDIHFRTQTSFKDHNGREKRPDFIINLPDSKHLVIDSKVSLTAYEKYYNCQNENDKKQFLKEHLLSVRSHIKDLNSKNYQQLYQINSPDYLLLFVPIEPAFSLATQFDDKIFLDALDKNIVIVTTSTLLATMRTVSYIWKQEKQKKSVLEIARQSGMLYDKFVNFIDNLKEIGLRLDQTQSAYHDAMNKLVDSKKYGDTLVGRAEKIKELGARTSKSLPKDLLE